MFKFSRVFLSVFVLLSLFLTGIIGCGSCSSDNSDNPIPNPNPPPSFMPLSYLSECKSNDNSKMLLIDEGGGIYYFGRRSYEDKNCQCKYFDFIMYSSLKEEIVGSIEDYVKGKKLVLKSVPNINDSGNFMFISGNTSSDTSLPIKYEEFSHVCGYKPDGKAYPIYINKDCPKLFVFPEEIPPSDKTREEEVSFSYDGKTLTMCPNDNSSQCVKLIKE